MLRVRTIHRGWLLSLTLALVGVVGCDKSVEKKETPALKLDLGESQLSHPSGSALSRASYVAQADALALAAGQAEQGKSRALYEQAAQLRYRAFVEFGKKVDGLEALELLTNLPVQHGEHGCQAELLSLQIEVALGKEPEHQYRDLFVLRERAGSSECRGRMGRALSALAAFQPSPDQLTKLRDNLRLESDKAAAPPSEHTSHESVVVPEHLRASLDQPATITRIEPFVAERTARVVVHVTHPTRFNVGTLKAEGGLGPRVFVDIDHASFKKLDTFEAEEGLLKRVRLGKTNTGARVVLDLDRTTYHRVFYLPDPFRLVIDLSLDPPDNQANLRSLRRVVLDPGHGGHDPGAVGPNGLQEKDVALDVAHRAAPLLAREVGVSTLLTRDMDVFVPLDERAARANAFHADLFISIHLNSNPDPASRGVMTFVLDASRDSAASKVAARENASTEAAAVELANSLSRIDNIARREAAETFAGLLQRAAGASLRQKYEDVLDSGVRRAGFYVLAGASMPAVLFEGSFISNPMEADRLNQEDYRQRLADAIVNAVLAYREGM